MAKQVDSSNIGTLLQGVFTKIKNAFWAKDSTSQLSIDSTPTANSNNLVKSGGVYTAVAAKYTKPANGIPARDIEAGVIPDAVEANPTVPSGTTPTDLAGLKVGNSYYGIPQLPTVDNTPTANSNNLVKSGGVYSEIHPAVASTQPQGGFLPNVEYNLGTLTGSVTFALASAVTGISNKWYWCFKAGATAPTITWPTGLLWPQPDAEPPTIEANDEVEVEVKNGHIVALVFKPTS